MLVLPGIVVAGVLLAFAASEGGYLPVTWYPGLVFFLLLLAATVAGRGPALATMPRIVHVALALGAAFVLWSFASIAWADVSGVAWDAANRSLLYFALFAIFCIWPWPTWAAAATVAIFGLGVALIGFVVVVKAGGAPDPLTYLIKERFAEPVGYPNGNAALFLGAAWPLLFLASRPEPPWPFRGLALGGATVLVQLAVLGQSRGSVLAGGLALVLYFAFVPGRMRSLLAVLAVAAGTLWALDAQLAIFSEAKAGGDVGEALVRSSEAMIRSFVALVAAGSLWGMAERYLEVPEELATVARRAGAAVLALVAGGAVVAALVVVGNPIPEVEDRWDEFTSGQPKEFGSSRFSTGLGSYRSEFWDVALDELGRRPLTGMGAGNFSVAYARERPRASEEPLYAHSLPVEVVSQTGVVGAILFTGFIGCALAAAWRARRHPALRRGLAAAAAVAFAYWLLHAAGDWLWAMPVLAGAAFAWLGLAVALGREPSTPEEGTVGEAGAYRAETGRLLVRGGRWWVLGLAGLAAVTLATLAATVPPWLAAVEADAARSGWRSDPARAFERLDRARELNPLSDQPDLIAGAIAIQLDDRDRARDAFAGAVERNPKGWFAQQQLGIEEALAGGTEPALAHLKRARELNPLEETTRLLLQEVRAGERPSAVDVRNELAARVCLPVPAATGC